MGFGRDIERRLDTVLDRIPGYRGYRAKEDRRDADRRVREHLATAFAGQAERVERVARELADQRRLADIAPVDEFARAVRHLIDRIGALPFGYGGLFSDRDVDERALDQIRLFDEGLMAGVAELEIPIGQLESAFASGENLATPARAGSTATRAILTRLSLRQQVVETAEPAPEESVLAALEAGGAAPHAAYNLAIDDALSILGDNFVVDARLDLDADEHGLRLFRLRGGNAERWLAVAKRAEDGLASVAPSTDAVAEGANGGGPTIGGALYAVVAAGSGEGVLDGAGGSSGRRPVRYRLLRGETDAAARAVAIDWGTERQLFVGTSVHPNDVEVFASAPADALN